MAVFTVNEFGGLLDLIATSPEYRRYGIATHMIYVIQAIVNVIKKIQQLLYIVMMELKILTQTWVFILMISVTKTFCIILN